MLTKITLNNFKSFKNTTTIDLVSGDHARYSRNEKNNVLKVCAFQGTNASGKSTILVGVKFLLDLLFSETEVNLNAYHCLFCENPYYWISYEFTVLGRYVKYTFEVNTNNSAIAEQLFLGEKLLFERKGLFAKSYIGNVNGVQYDETDIGKDTLFLRILYFNTKFASNSVLRVWMDYLKKSYYISIADSVIISYENTTASLSDYLEGKGCQSINNFFCEYGFEQVIAYEHDRSNGWYSIIQGAERENNIFFKRKGIDCLIPFAKESSGNQILLRILSAYLNVIEDGGMLLIDDFSSHMHHNLENLLIRHFAKNAYEAQMLFVSNSVSLFRNADITQDQAYLVEFQCGVGSSVKRLSEDNNAACQSV